MTRETAIAALEVCRQLAETDPELAHVEADDVLRALLTSLGFADVVEAYDRAINWFA